MNNAYNATLHVVIAKIRSTIAEDWIYDYEIGPATRFNGDLELESIEFVKIADAIQGHFGTQVDIISWLSGKSIHELISLSVGDVTSLIAASAPRA